MARKNDPYYDIKVYHYAAKVNQHGDVSALCYKKPRIIPLHKGQSWTSQPDGVTCWRCKRALQIAVEALECYSGLDPHTIASEALHEITAIAEGKCDE